MSLYIFNEVDKGRKKPAPETKPDGSAEESKSEAPSSLPPPPAALVLGASGGIGLAVTKALAMEGLHVYAAVRKPTAELKAVDGISIIPRVDYCKKDFTRPLLLALEDVEKLRYVVVCTGEFGVDTLSTVSAASTMSLFMANAVGPILAMQALESKFEDNVTKIAFLSARAGSTASITSGGLYGFRMSKAALNSGVVSLSKDLAPRGVAVTLIDPGFVDTKMTEAVKLPGKISTFKAADGILQRLAALTSSSSGSFTDLLGSAMHF